MHNFIWFWQFRRKTIVLKINQCLWNWPKSGLAIMASVADHGGLINAIEGKMLHI